MNSAILELENAAGTSLIQREPYPVVAPMRRELITEIIRIAINRRQKILIFGNGSSFDTELSLLRDNVIGITTSNLSGIAKLGSFCFAVNSGTMITDVLESEDFSAGRTLGGFLAGNLAGHERELRRGLWKHVRAIEIIDGKGGLRRLSGPAQSASAHTSGAELMIGSAGRTGVITGIELSLKPPIHIELPVDATTQMSLSSAGRPPFVREVVADLNDPHEIFKW
jgi:FAD/FMN-containing dehydrogenase